MKKFLSVCVVTTVICSFVLGAFAGASPGEKKGEAMFKQYCAVCHPDGGNIINPQKTLHKKDRDANNIKTAEDIMHTMRNPGLGMTKFDDKTIPDKDAKEIAEYIFKTFK